MNDTVTNLPTRLAAIVVALRSPNPDAALAPLLEGPRTGRTVTLDADELAELLTAAAAPAADSGFWSDLWLDLEADQAAHEFCDNGRALASTASRAISEGQRLARERDLWHALCVRQREALDRAYREAGRAAAEASHAAEREARVVGELITAKARIAVALGDEGEGPGPTWAQMEGRALALAQAAAALSEIGAAADEAFNVEHVTWPAIRDASLELLHFFVALRERLGGTIQIKEGGDLTTIEDVTRETVAVLEFCDAVLLQLHPSGSISHKGAIERIRGWRRLVSRARQIGLPEEDVTTCHAWAMVADQVDMDQPPPGYVVWLDDEWCCWCFGKIEDGLSINVEPIESADLAIASAWAHVCVQECPR